MLMELLFWQKRAGRPQCFVLFKADLEMILTSLGRCLSHVSHWHMPFKKTNKNVTEQLTSNSALDFETWCRELVQCCLNNSHAICACIRKHNILQFIY